MNPLYEGFGNLWPRFSRLAALAIIHRTALAVKVIAKHLRHDWQRQAGRIHVSGQVHRLLWQRRRGRHCISLGMDGPAAWETAAKTSSGEWWLN